MQKVKVYKCPIDGKGYKSLQVWGNHMTKEHPGTIPDGWSYARYYYYLLTGKDHGTCIICKRDTEWNEATQKYSRFCDNPKCKEKYRDIFKDRMIKAGKIDQMNDPNFQRAMLQQRGISHTYQFPDGTKIEYVGKYEEDFLYMLDHMINWPSTDIMGPSPHNYEYDYFNPAEYTAFELERSSVPTMLIQGKDADRLFYSSIDRAVLDIDRNIYANAIEKNPSNRDGGYMTLDVYGTTAFLGMDGGGVAPKRVTVKRLGAIRINPILKEYTWNEKEIEKRIYIPDFYIPTLNLEIEIKQSTNMHPKILRVDKVKEEAKDVAMKAQTVTNYLKILEKDYSEFYQFLYNEKERVNSSMTRTGVVTLPGIEQTSEVSETVLPYNEENVKRYKEKSSGFKFGLKHARTGKNIKGQMYISPDDELIGYFGVDQTTKYIQCFEVNPKYQNAGYGKRMMDDAIQSYHAKYLTVSRVNVSAIRFYKNYGWKYQRSPQIEGPVLTYEYQL